MGTSLAKVAIFNVHLGLYIVHVYDVRVYWQPVHLMCEE